MKTSPEKAISQYLKSQTLPVAADILYLNGMPELPELSFLSFLHATGRGRATLLSLRSQDVGDYWEFLTEWYGTRHANRAMAALRDFWIWSQKEKLIPDSEIPFDLQPNSLGRGRFEKKLRIQTEETHRSSLFSSRESGVLSELEQLERFDVQDFSVAEQEGDVDIMRTRL